MPTSRRCSWQQRDAAAPRSRARIHKTTRRPNPFHVSCPSRRHERRAQEALGRLPPAYEVSRREVRSALGKPAPARTVSSGAPSVAQAAPSCIARDDARPDPRLAWSGTARRRRTGCREVDLVIPWRRALFRTEPGPKRQNRSGRTAPRLRGMAGGAGGIALDCGECLAGRREGRETAAAHTLCSAWRVPRCHVLGRSDDGNLVCWRSSVWALPERRSLKEAGPMPRAARKLSEQEPTTPSSIHH